MWFDIDKVNLSEDHYENYFFWPLMLWLECNFNNPANRANQEVLTILKPTRVAEGRKYHSDLVVYGEYPFLLQYKPPIRDPFATHSNCWECGYSPDFDSELSQWERIEFPNFRRKSFKSHHVGQPFHLADLRA